MDKTFKSVHTLKDISISLCLLAAGTGLYFLNAGLGFTIGMAGILMLLFYKSGFVREGSGIVLTKKAIDVACSCRRSLSDFLAGKNVELVIREPGNGAVVRIEVYYNKKEGVAYVQLYDFSQNAYEKNGSMVELHEPCTSRLLEKLR